MNGELVIGMNASTLALAQYGVKAQYYVCSDQRFIQHTDKRRFAVDDLPRDTVRVFRKELKEHDDEILSASTYYVPAIGRDGFSRDLSYGYYFGCTTTMLALQLAAYIGSHEVYLLGCDLRYRDDQPRFYKETHPQIEDQFTSVQLHNIIGAAEAFEQRGGALHNCSEFSFLRPYIGFLPYDTIWSEAAV